LHTHPAALHTPERQPKTFADTYVNLCRFRNGKSVETTEFFAPLAVAAGIGQAHNSDAPTARGFRHRDLPRCDPLDRFRKYSLPSRRILWTHTSSRHPLLLWLAPSHGGRAALNFFGTSITAAQRFGVTIELVQALKARAIHPTVGWPGRCPRPAGTHGRRLPPGGHAHASRSRTGRRRP
jgi:hypothetical protein